MELWVRSQNKEKLNIAKDIEIKEYTERTFSIEINGYALGSYRTKERALEVLDEIQENLIMAHTTHIVGYNNVVFYSMPEE